MNFENVSIAGLGYSLPPHILTSLEIEERLAPVYDRIRLHSGRLELMTGIRERRYWDEHIQPSDAAAEARAESSRCPQHNPGNANMNTTRTRT